MSQMTDNGDTSGARIPRATYRENSPHQPTHQEPGVNEGSCSKDGPDSASNTQPALDGVGGIHRELRSRYATSWMKKIGWVLFLVYGLLRLYAPEYEEHHEQWGQQQRRN